MILLLLFWLNLSLEGVVLYAYISGNTVSAGLALQNKNTEKDIKTLQVET